jgi:hemoglobin-like flavoprotein/serine/threonine protein kinase
VSPFKTKARLEAEIVVLRHQLRRKTRRECIHTRCVMESENSGHLFVSYSHDDEPDMLIFRKHLRGMLLNKVDVWSDRDISKGAVWDSILKDNLNQANSALVLATPDYLISSWCRTELQQLSDAKRTGRLRNLFWVQLRPCGWQHTELRDFQAFASEQAINEFPDETSRQRAILQVCERIATEIVRSATDQDRELATVRRLLAKSDTHNLTIDRVLSNKSFSIVCQGFDGSRSVAIKVLKFFPLEGLMDTLLRIGNERIQLADPSFTKIQKVFQSGSGDERRTIFVSDYIGNAELLAEKLSYPDREKQKFDVDRVVQLLRRMAHGLAELHRDTDDGPNAWERTLGLLTPDDIFYDSRSVRLTVPSIGVSSFLWHTLDCEKYVDWVDPKSLVYVTPEQRARLGQRLTPRADQYMLGRLGVEMLEDLRFEHILDGKPAEQFWHEPEDFIRGRWKGHHQQLWKVLRKLLEKDPSDRFQNMESVEQSLHSLEGFGRALAKSVYVASPDTEAPGKLDIKFFEEFYRTFFERSPESKGRFASFQERDQHKQLMGAMAAVLNFRHGNRPTSLDKIIAVHREMKITSIEFERFYESFVETMRKSVGEPQVQEAWENLLKPVIDHMIAECARKHEGGEHRIIQNVPVAPAPPKRDR